MDFLGNGLANNITGTTGDDLISGRGGNDTLAGGGGFDRIFGGDGNDFVSGYGNLRGGTGHDELGGGGVLMGEAGRDLVELFDKGSAYGGVGNDRLRAVLHFPGDGEERDLIGGKGADSFAVNLSPLDGIAVRVEVLDFQRVQGDRLFLDQRDPNGNPLVSAAATFDDLDLNHDRVLSAADGGRVHADPAGGLAIEGPDGDVMILVGRSAVFASDFMLG